MELESTGEAEQKQGILKSDSDYLLRSLSYSEVRETALAHCAQNNQAEFDSNCASPGTLQPTRQQRPHDKLQAYPQGTLPSKEGLRFLPGSLPRASPLHHPSSRACRQQTCTEAARRLDVETRETQLDERSSKRAERLADFESRGSELEEKATRLTENRPPRDPRQGDSRPSRHERNGLSIRPSSRGTPE